MKRLIYLFLFCFSIQADAQYTVLRSKRLYGDERFFLPPLSANPTTYLRDGLAYYNTISDEVRVYANGVWVALGSGGGGSSNWTVDGAAIWRNSNTGIGVTPLYRLHVKEGNSSFFFTDAGTFPRLYIGGSSSTVAGIFTRITAGASIYFGEESDGGGIYFRGTGGAHTVASVASGQVFNTIQNNASNATANKARLSLLPHAGFTQAIAPYIESINATDNASLAFGTYDGSLTEKMRIFHNGNVAIGSTSDLASALLQVTSTTKGFLAPRMTTTQMNAISSPAEGLLIYNTTTASYHFRDASEWIDMNGGIVFSGTYFSGGGTSGSPITLVVVTASGTYTPTSSNGANMSSSTPSVSEYTRVGNIVSVTGTVSVTVSAGASSVELTLPVASNFTASTQAHGVVASQSGASSVALYLLSSNGTSDQINISFTGATAETFTITYTYKYSVL